MGKELMAERCSGLFLCGIEMISSQTRTRSSGTSACSAAARTACCIATMSNVELLTSTVDATATIAPPSPSDEQPAKTTPSAVNLESCTVTHPDAATAFAASSMTRTIMTRHRD